MLSHCVLDYVAEGCAAAVILYASVCPCACGKNSVFVKREERMSAERRVYNHRRAELHGNRVALHLSVCLCVHVCSRPIRIMWIIAGYVDCVNVEIEFVCLCALEQVRTAQDVFKREQMGSQMLLERMLHN